MIAWLGTVSVATPWLAWAALAMPAIVMLVHWYDRATRRQLARRLGDLPVVGRLMASASPGRRLVKDLLVAGALGLVVLALARPQVGGKRRVEVRGLDLVVAIDVSKSMLVDDVKSTAEMRTKGTQHSRLARARELATAVIDELAGDRIAPVVFAGAASHFPLTEDHQVAVRFLADFGPLDLPPGSNLAEVFRVSRCLLRPDLYEDLGCERIGRRGHGGDPLHGESLDPDRAGGSAGGPPEEDAALAEEIERGKAIVIFTDGGDPDPEVLREVATSRELGIAVFVVGVGSRLGGTVYEIDGITGKRGTVAKHEANGATVVSKRDDDGMRALAEAAGDARRFLIEPGEGMGEGEVDPMPVVTALRAVTRGLATKEVKEMKDIYQPVLFAGLMLLLIEVAIGTRRRRRYPEAG